MDRGPSLGALQVKQVVSGTLPDCRRRFRCPRAVDVPLGARPIRSTEKSAASGGARVQRV